jgi:hypothetical protein
MRKILLKRLFAFVLLAAAALCVSRGLILPEAAEAKKVKVEVEVDDDSGKPVKKSIPATFPVTLVNKSGSTAYVAILYYDVNAKNWHCQGWWNVKGNSKRTVKFPHSGKYIYYYVEKGGRVVSRTGTSSGVNWTVTKKAFSYLKGKMPKLDKPYKAHFVRGGSEDGWFQLTIN